MNPSLPLPVRMLADARGLLAMLGIVLHSARIYSTEPFLLSDPQRSGLFSMLVAFIHAFRMEAFFLIAGYTLYRLNKKAPDDLFSQRMVRLLVPMAATVILLNLPLLKLIDAFYLHAPNGVHRFGLGDLSWLTSDEWLMHTWFLRDLALFTALFCWVASSGALSALLSRSTGFLANPLFLLALPLAFTIPAVASHLIPSLYEPVLGKQWGVSGSPKELLYYGQYFLLGIGVSRFPQWLQSIMTFRRDWVLISVAVCLLCLLVSHASGSGHNLAYLIGHKMVTQGVIEIIRQAATLALIYLCFQLTARLHQTRLSVPLKRWSGASYTIYLVHQPVIWFLALALQNLGGPIILKFMFLVIASTVVSLAFDRVIVKRRTWGQWAFSGNFASRSSAMRY